MAKEPSKADASVVERIIEKSIAPYRGLVSPEMLTAMAEQLELFLTTHPVASKMVDRLEQQAAIDGTGNVVRGDADDAAATPPAPDGKEEER